MSIYRRFRLAIQTAGAVCIENFSLGSILIEDEIDDLGNVSASDLIKTVVKPLVSTTGI